MTGKQPCGIYIHLPFCAQKCPYCHFFVLPNQERFKEQLHQALQIECLRAIEIIENRVVQSVYFGGGTPALYGPQRVKEILDLFRNSNMCLADDIEITLEANPESLTQEEVLAYKNGGINRMSIGVQSLHDPTLEILGRKHSAKKAIECIQMIHNCGIDNISIDLMYEVPKQSLATWKKTLEAIQQLPITHLSLYNLTIEPHTSYYKKREEIAKQLPPDDVATEMLDCAINDLEAIGLERYEISAFAKPGYNSKHNSSYWLGTPFLGLGPSAYSFWNRERFQNVANLGKYCRALENNQNGIDFREKLPYPDNIKELLMINLRMMEGVNISQFEKKWGYSLPQESVEVLKQGTRDGFLTMKNGRYKLTQRGALFFDTFAAELI